jgi:hypothetical protein
MVSSAVLAQSPTLTTQVSGQSQLNINSNQCGQGYNVNWTTNLYSFTACDGTPLTFWITLGTCGAGADAGDYSLNPSLTGWGSQSTGQVPGGFQVNQLPAFAFVDGGCPAAVIDATHTICGAGYAGPPTCQTRLSLTSATVRFKSTPPSTPTIVSVDSSDSALTVNVTVSSDTSTFRVQYRPDGSSTWYDAGPFSVSASGSGVGRITGLQNGLRYEIRAIAKDTAGNESPPSDSTFQTPYQTIGFWGQYQNDGGKDNGGCASVGGTLAMALLAVGLLSFARSRRWR